MNIKGRLVTLRAVEEDDLPRLHRWANEPEVQDGIGGIHPPSSFAYHQAWFEGLGARPDSLRLAVDVPGVGIVGLSSLMDIDWRCRHAWHGLLIGDGEYRGRGFGVDAVMATMKYAFEELGLHRLNGSMIAYNEASIAFYCGTRLGWRREGVRRDYFFRKGRYWDEVLVGVTKDDYLATVAATSYWDAE